MESNKSLENKTKYCKLEQSEFEKNLDKIVVPPPNTVAPIDKSKIEVPSRTKTPSAPPSRPSYLQRISRLFCFRQDDSQDNLSQSNSYNPTTTLR